MYNYTNNYSNNDLEIKFYSIILGIVFLFLFILIVSYCYSPRLQELDRSGCNLL